MPNYDGLWIAEGHYSYQDMDLRIVMVNDVLAYESTLDRLLKKLIRMRVSSMYTVRVFRPDGHELIGWRNQAVHYTEDNDATAK